MWCLAYLYLVIQCTSINLCCVLMLAESEEWLLWIQSVRIELSRPSRARGLKHHKGVNGI